MADVTVSKTVASIIGTIMTVMLGVIGFFLVTGLEHIDRSINENKTAITAINNSVKDKHDDLVKLISGQQTVDAELMIRVSNNEVKVADHEVRIRKLEEK